MIYIKVFSQIYLPSIGRFLELDGAQSSGKTFSSQKLHWTSFKESMYFFLFLLWYLVSTLAPPCPPPTTQQSELVISLQLVIIGNLAFLAPNVIFLILNYSLGLVTDPVHCGLWWYCHTFHENAEGVLLKVRLFMNTLTNINIAEIKTISDQILFVLANMDIVLADSDVNGPNEKVHFLRQKHKTYLKNIRPCSNLTQLYSQYIFFNLFGFG